MSIAIQIHYISAGNKVMRQGNFKLNGKKPEVAALEFWKWIQRRLPYGGHLQKVIAAGEDITELVNNLILPPKSRVCYPNEGGAYNTEKGE